MIDATASLVAAEQISAATLIDYLRTTGWSSRPSRAEGIAIFSKRLAGADNSVQFILPVELGVDEEQRRVADALRTLAQVEGCSEAEIAEKVMQAAGKGKPRDLFPVAAIELPETRKRALQEKEVAFVDFMADVDVITNKRIESAAEHLRKALGISDQNVFDIVWLLETEMPKLINHFRFVVAAKSTVREVYSKAFPPCIIATEHVYRLARQGDARSRFILAHEIGHLLLHSPFHAYFKTSKHERNVESQASKFAVAFLIPGPLARQFNDAGLLSAYCQVNREVAELRMAYFDADDTKNKHDIDRRFQHLRSRVESGQLRE